MAKCILMSIKPKYLSMILNKAKTIEVRKRFPSDYFGWVYIYCTHGRHLLDLRKENTKDNYRLTIQRESNNVRWSYPPLLNGKVVARFWCEKVEEINFHVSYNEHIRGYRLSNIYSTEKDLLKKSCLTQHELYSYLPHISPCGYAIHITNLEIFDKPKEISEFSHYDNSQYQALPNGEQYKGVLEPLTRAPESYCYIEV